MVSSGAVQERKRDNVASNCLLGKEAGLKNYTWHYSRLLNWRISGYIVDRISGHSLSCMLGQQQLSIGTIFVVKFACTWYYWTSTTNWRAGIIVEIDESKFGKYKYHWGKRVDGIWLFGGVERDTGRCFLEVVKDRTKKTFLASIKKDILPGSIFYSDCWKAYDCLQSKAMDMELWTTQSTSKSWPLVYVQTALRVVGTLSIIIVVSTFSQNVLHSMITISSHTNGISLPFIQFDWIEFNIPWAR